MNLDNKKSFIHAACSAAEKATWVKAAIASNLKLTAWVVRALNDRAEKDLRKEDEQS